MRMCGGHWDLLRAGIEAAGLASLVPEDGTAAFRNMVDGMSSGVTVDNFDPLMYAHNNILSNAIDAASLAAGSDGVIELMNDNNVGRGCPICFLQAKHDMSCDEDGCAYSYEPWIDYATQGALEKWREFGQ